MGYSWSQPISLRGAAGPAGVGFTTTSGQPTDQGQPGECRIDTSAFVLWAWNSSFSTWVASQSFKGVQGISGPGSLFFYGNGAPTPSSPSVPADTNAVYLQSTGEVYSWSQNSSMWVDTGENFTGPQGPAARRGSVLFEGNGPPPSDPSTLSVGDIHGALPGDTYRDVSAGGPYEYYFS